MSEGLPRNSLESKRRAAWQRTPWKISNVWCEKVSIKGKLVGSHTRSHLFTLCQLLNWIQYTRESSIALAVAPANKYYCRPATKKNSGECFKWCKFAECKLAGHEHRLLQRHEANQRKNAIKTRFSQKRLHVQQRTCFESPYYFQQV